MPKPGDLAIDDVRRVGAKVIDAIADYHESLERRPVMPDVAPDGVAGRFAADLPEQGESADALVDDWRERVAPLLTAVGSPRHFAYVNGSGAMIGSFAEALAACTNTSAGSWNLGPAATEMERQCLRWIARFVGYPEDAGGILVSGGTMANFTALTAALRHVAPYDSTRGGLQSSGRAGRFLVYMADHEGHVSVTRVADMMNLGRDAVRLVPSRDDFTIDVAALDAMLAADRARGDMPLAVVAQLGSVNVGAVDPIGALADVCSKHGVWLHGDGACGLFAAGLPETRTRFRGLERADSVSTDAHKWLGVPYDCGIVLVRHAERLHRAFSIAAPYLDTLSGGRDFLELGPEMSRGFRALKVSMVMRFFGARGLRAVFSKSLALAKRLHSLVREHPDFEVLHEPTLYVYSFRFVPNLLSDREGEPEVAAFVDRLNEDIARAVAQTGFAFLMTTRIRGRVALRMSMCSHRTTEDDIDATFAGIASIGRELARRSTHVSATSTEESSREERASC
jgi:glutamate/tyrosine decarboxylase-like PLP-dependent enzyme